MTACIFVCAVGMLDGNEGDRGVYASDSLEATLAAKAGEMDTRHVEEFLILSKTLNYTTAAQEAFIARPTLVEHIAELEGEIGCVLFSKCEGKLSLTPIGRRFVRTASLLLDRVECIVEEYRSLPIIFFRCVSRPPICHGSKATRIKRAARCESARRKRLLK